MQGVPILHSSALVGYYVNKKTYESIYKIFINFCGLYNVYTFLLSYDSFSE